MALETNGIWATRLTEQGEERVSKKTSREIKITKIELVSKKNSGSFISIYLGIEYLSRSWEKFLNPYLVLDAHLWL